MAFLKATENIILNLDLWLLLYSMNIAFWIDTKHLMLELNSTSQGVKYQTQQSLKH